MNFSVLVTGETMSAGVGILSSMGLTTVFEPLDTVVSTMRKGASNRLMVDAIVVDGTASSGNPLEDRGSLRAINAAQAIAKLSGMYVMPSGVRWNAVPLILVGDEPGLEEAIRFDPVLSKATYVGESPMFGGAEAKLWGCVYDALRRRYLEFGPLLAEALQTAGLILAEHRGQVLRAGLRAGLRRQDVENAYYDGAHDRFFDARSGAMRRILSVLYGGPDSVARALDDLARLATDPRAPEALPEALVHRNLYLFDVAPFEAVGQRSITLADGSRIRTDLLRISYGAAHGRPGAEIFEFKRGGHRQLRGRTLAWTEADGAEQLVLYAAAFERSRHLVERRLGEPFGRPALRLVGGYVGDADRTGLARARNRYPEIDVEGWDEVALRERARFAIPDEWEPASA